MQKETYEENASAKSALHFPEERDELGDGSFHSPGASTEGQ